MPEELNPQLIRAECEKVPGFSGGTAFERTMICCDVLTRQGLQVPSWMLIRQIIEKGSSTDIERAKREWRIKHGEFLTSMSAAPAGIPEALGSPMHALWTEALKHATETFGSQVEAWTGRMNELEAERKQQLVVIQQIEHAQAEAERKLVATSRELADARAALVAEREDRAQAERAMSNLRAAVTAERDELRAQVERLGKDLTQATEQFQKASKAAADRVAAAAAQAEKTEAWARQAVQAKEAQWAAERVLLSSQINALQADLAAVSGKFAAANAELNRMRRQRAPAQKLPRQKLARTRKS